MQPHGEEMIARRLAWLIQAWIRAGSASAPSSRKDGEQRRVLRFCVNLLETEDVKEKESGTEKVANSSIVDQIAFDQRKRDWSCLHAAVGKLTLWRAAMKRSASAGILRIFVCSCGGAHRPHKHGGRRQVLPW